MTSSELYGYQRMFTQWAAERLLSVGADQYSLPGRQKFEDMPTIDLITGLREELADIINYAVMLDIRLARAHFDE